jgi:hypothetical protein
MQTAELNWFYSDPENCLILKRVIRSWQGTPFRENHARKQVGVDCVRFAEAVHRETGALPEAVNFPEYKAYGKGEQWLNMLTEQLDEIDQLEWVFSRNEEGAVDFKKLLMPGDVLVFSSGAAFHHLAIMEVWPSCWSAFPTGVTMDRFHHAKSGGVVESHLTDPMVAKLLQRVYRFAA